MRRQRHEKGSILVIAAVGMMVLIAFVGLVVDGGEITSQVRVSQNAADGAALAAAWEFAENSQSTTNAEKLGNLVAGKNGIPTADLTLTWLDSNHNPTSTLSAIQYVDADVKHNFATIFLPIIDINSASASAHAEVQVVADPYSCVLCALDPHASGALTVAANVTVTGGSTTVNSDSATALNAIANFTDSPGIALVGGYSGSNISPTPTTHVAPQADPLSAIAMPTLSSYTACTNQGVITGAGPWAPGVYSGINVGGNIGVQLDGAASGSCGMPGVFVFTGNINLTGNATLSTVNGAMIFLTCSSFPTSYCGGNSTATGACPNAGAAGATLYEGGSSQTHFSPSPGYGGPYAGMAVFADRCNKPGAGYLIDYSGNGISGSSSLSGTIYAANGAFHVGGNESWTLSSRVVANTIRFDDALTDSFSSNVNYTPQTKLLLVQ